MSSSGVLEFVGNAVVTRNAPINPEHPSFAGGAKFDDSTDDTAAIQAALDYGGVNSAVILPGRAVTTGTVTGHPGQRIYGLVRGDGTSAGCGLRCTANGVPILAITAAAGVSDGGLEHLFLKYNQQQTLAANPNSSAVQYSSQLKTSGAANNVLRDLRIDAATYGISWLEASPANGCAFWNNDLDDIHMTNIAGSLIADRSTSPVGNPTNKCGRLTHIGAGGAPGGAYAIELGAGGAEWVFDSLDIEDWTDGLLHAINPPTLVRVKHVHLERHTIATEAATLFRVSGGAGFYLDQLQAGSSAAATTGFIINIATTADLIFAHAGGGIGAKGAIGTIIANKSSNSTGAGILNLFNFDGPPTAFTIGPRTINSASIRDWDPAGVVPEGVVSDSGLPPIWVATTALPAASATYRSRQFRLQAAAGSADTLVQCMKSSTETYSWKTIVTG